MFKVCVEASSFEELKAQLEPMFKMMDKFSAPVVPTAEDLGYSEDGDESSEPVSSPPFIKESPVVTAPVTLSTPSVPPVPIMVPVAASPAVDTGDGDDSEGNLPTDNSGGPDRDARGIPWDNRIHTANRALKKDGTWKYRRGVDETVIAEVEKGLTAPATPVVVPTFPNAAPVPAIPTLPPAFPVAQPVASEPTPIAPVVAAQPAQAAPIPEIATAPAVRPAHTPQSFQANLPMVINTLIAQKKVDRPWLVNIAQHFGVQEWWDIAKYDDKCRQLFDACVQWGFITNVG